MAFSGIIHIFAGIAGWRVMRRRADGKTVLCVLCCGLRFDSSEIRMPMKTLKQFYNITERVIDDLKQALLSGDAQISVAAASFSIYAYEALKEELEKVECVNFIFTSPTFTTDRAEKQKRELVDKEMLISNNKRRWASYSINDNYIQGVKKSRSKTQGVKKSRSKSQGVTSRERKQQELREVLVVFCREPRTLQEIANHLGYSDRNRMKRVYINFNTIIGRNLLSSIRNCSRRPGSPQKKPFCRCRG